MDITHTRQQPPQRPDTTPTFNPVILSWADQRQQAPKRSELSVLPLLRWAVEQIEASIVVHRMHLLPTPEPTGQKLQGKALHMPYHHHHTTMTRLSMTKGWLSMGHMETDHTEAANLSFETYRPKETQGLKTHQLFHIKGMPELLKTSDSPVCFIFYVDPRISTTLGRIWSTASCLKLPPIFLEFCTNRPFYWVVKPHQSLGTEYTIPVFPLFFASGVCSVRE